MFSAIVYYSITGNTKSFAERFKAEGFEVIPIREALGLDKPFVIFSPTYNFGEVPAPVKRFLNDKSALLHGVVAFGNRNWGEGYALAGDKISQQYAVPLLGKVELRGTGSDYDRVYHIIKETLHGRLK